MSRDLPRLLSPDVPMKTSARWARKRREIIERDGDECAHCGERGTRLNVHHRYYESGKANWDYPSNTLTALCPKCHGRADELRRDLARATGPLHEPLAERALGYMQGLALQDGEVDGDRLRVLTWEHAEGIGDVFAVRADDVLGAIVAGVVTLSALCSMSPLRRYRVPGANE